MHDIKRILVVSRCTKDCKKALHQGISLARSCGAELSILHITSDLELVGLVGGPMYAPLLADLEKEYHSAVVKEYGEEARFRLVFHGGSGSPIEEIHAAVDYGVVKMNIDTNTQYAFTRAIADHMFKNYDGVLKVDGDVGNKKAYDPRPYMEKAEIAMAERVKQAAAELRSVGTTMMK